MNKIAMITGSSRGIGKAIALFFAKKGYDIIINSSKSRDDLLNVQSEIEQLGVCCHAYLTDLSDRDAVDAMYKDIFSYTSSIDVLINNAGISKIGLFQDLSYEEWDHIMKSNIYSVYSCCNHVVPSMINAKSGSIINISSMWGITGASCEVAYSASKGAVNSFTKALAKELAPSNIQVNAIACGVINTSMNNFLDEDEMNCLIEEIPAGRMGTPEEVAALAYNITTTGSYLTGQVITLDGGMI